MGRTAAPAPAAGPRRRRQEVLRGAQNAWPDVSLHALLPARPAAVPATGAFTQVLSSRCRRRCESACKWVTEPVQHEMLVVEDMVEDARWVHAMCRRRLAGSAGAGRAERRRRPGTRARCRARPAAAAAAWGVAGLAGLGGTNRCQRGAQLQAVCIARAGCACPCSLRPPPHPAWLLLAPCATPSSVPEGLAPQVLGQLLGARPAAHALLRVRPACID